LSCLPRKDHALSVDETVYREQPLRHTKDQDRKTLKRINLLIQDVVRNGNEGIGKRGPLKHDFAGYWSRRILDEHRLVYKVMKNEVRIAACRYHYGKQRLALC
jgi:toxin YoeB